MNKNARQSFKFTELLGKLAESDDHRLRLKGSANENENKRPEEFVYIRLHVIFVTSSALVPFARRNQDIVWIIANAKRHAG